MTAGRINQVSFWIQTLLFSGGNVPCNEASGRAVIHFFYGAQLSYSAPVLSSPTEYELVLFLSFIIRILPHLVVFRRDPWRVSDRNSLTPLFSFNSIELASVATHFQHNWHTSVHSGAHHQHPAPQPNEFHSASGTLSSSGAPVSYSVDSRQSLELSRSQRHPSIKAVALTGRT